VAEDDHHCSNLYQAIFFVSFSISFLYPVLYHLLGNNLDLTCYLTFKLFQSRRTSLRKKAMICWRTNCRWNNGCSTLSPLSL